MVTKVLVHKNGFISDFIFSALLNTLLQSKTHCYQLLSPFFLPVIGFDAVVTPLVLKQQTVLKTSNFYVLVIIKDPTF